MTETEVTTKRPRHLLARIVTVSGAILCLVFIGVYLLATIYLRTSSAAHRTSQFLTEYLHHPVTVAELALTGRTLSINGLTISNLAEFRGGELASCRSITITPDWLGFLGGRKSFAEVAILGGKIGIGRNERGEWNFHELLRRLAEKKGTGETLIRRLTIGDSSLAVEGVRLDHLALTVRDIATKGTAGSRFLLTCKDAGGNPVRLEGSARLGADPSLDLELSAPFFSLQTFAGSFARKDGPGLGNGTGTLLLTLKLHGGTVAVQGKLGVDSLALAVKDGRIPVHGDLDFAARYDVNRDEATLDACSVRLNGIVRMRASGTVRQARKT